MERRLAAILAADVVGYSRLMEMDEAGTLATLKTYLRELIDPAIAKHYGRTVKLMGDGLLVEFPSAVEAVQCAIDMQYAMEERNAGIAEDRQITFRIGINIGDVIVEDGDLYGDGVNITARLEALAEPGEICISRTVYNHIKNKVPMGFEDLGEQKVKNIAEPVRVYRVLPEGKAGSPAKVPSKRRQKRTRPILYSAIGILLVAGFVLVWWQPWESTFEPASIEKMAFPLPEKHSIAVVPFKKLSDDDSADAPIDALSEQLIATLGKLRTAFVIAKDSSFELAEAGVEVRDFSERLGVRYVLEGAYETAGRDVRITVQLSDALQGRTVWSKIFKLPSRDVFILQKEISIGIATVLKISLTEAEKVALAKPATDSREAWHLHAQASKEKQKWNSLANANARALWSQATKHDPAFALGWLMIGWTHWADVRFQWAENLSNSLHQAELSALTVAEMAPGDAAAYELLGSVYLLKLEHKKAVEYGEKAVSLNPNSASALANLAITYCFAGQPLEAKRLIDAAIRLNPYYPTWYLLPLAEMYRLTGQYDKAIETVKEELRRLASPLTRTRLAIYYEQSGQNDLAKAEIRMVLDEKPRTTVAGWTEAKFFANPIQTEKDIASLKNIGLPEVLSFECLVRNECP